MKVPRLTKEELKKRIDRGDDLTILDVRNNVDYNASGEMIIGSVRIPLEELETRIDELDPDREVVTYCT